MDMPAGEARARIDRAKASVGQAREELIALWNGRAWISLGHASWDALCEAEFWGIRVALPVSERREVVSSMRAEGMSTRAIGSALGVDHSTVVRDLPTGADAPVPPERVTSLDGRQRPARQPAPEPERPDRTTQTQTQTQAQRRPPITRSFDTAVPAISKAIASVGRLVEDDRFPQNADQVAEKHLSDLIRARDAIAGIVDLLTQKES